MNTEVVATEQSISQQHSTTLIEIQHLLRELSSSLSLGNAKASSANARLIRVRSSSMGWRRLAERCEQLERLADSESQTMILFLFEGISRDYAELLEAVRIQH